MSGVELSNVWNPQGLVSLHMFIFAGLDYSYEIKTTDMVHYSIYLHGSSAETIGSAKKGRTYIANVDMSFFGFLDRSRWLNFKFSKMLEDFFFYAIASCIATRCSSISSSVSLTKFPSFPLT